MHTIFQNFQTLLMIEIFFLFNKVEFNVSDYNDNAPTSRADLDIKIDVWQSFKFLNKAF